MRPSGNNVANAFTDLAVRAAEGTYLAWLGSQIQPGEIIAIRQGGGPLGELRYPLPDDNGHTNSYWAYDASTQAALPAFRPGVDPGYRYNGPGAGLSRPPTTRTSSTTGSG